MHEHGIDRRTFLVGAGGIAAGSLLLSACGSGDTAAKPKQAVKPPTYVPYQGVKPDLPPGAGGVPAAFYTYPADAPTFVKGELEDAGTVTMMLEALSIAVPESRNQWWQALNKAVHADIKYHIVPAADYLQKFQIAVAGNDFPDIAQVLMLPNMGQVLDKQFADLSDHLSGDAIKKYPGLASIPTEAWKTVTINGRIWGIPQFRPTAGVICSYRSEVLNKLGVDPSQVTSGQDFLDFCKEVSSPSTKHWALAGLVSQYLLPFFIELMGGPNVWSEEGGKFTNWNESAQMKEALAVSADMWKKGYFHPDSFANPGEAFTLWQGGTTALYFQASTGWNYVTTYPTWQLGAIVPPKWDGGGQARKFLGASGAAYPDFAAFRKADDAKVSKLLKICDYLASPFGTKEFLTVNYGVEGHDYTIDNGNLKPTPAAGSEIMPIAYVGSQTFTTIYVPDNKAMVDAQYQYMQKVLPTGVSNAAFGLYSQTDLTKGATANKVLKDLQGEIIQGRKPVSAWDDAVTTWRRQAGDKARSEYEKAWAKAH